MVAIDKGAPADLNAHLVCDNLATHKRRSFANGSLDIFASTSTSPPGSSWIKQVERWFYYPTDQLTRSGARKRVQAIEAPVHAWTARRNTNPHSCVWKKTAKEILDSLARYLQWISGAEY